MQAVSLRDLRALAGSPWLWCPFLLSLHTPFTTKEPTILLPDLRTHSNCIKVQAEQKSRCKPNGTKGRQA